MPHTYPTYETSSGKTCNPAVSRPCGKICLGHSRTCYVQPENNPPGAFSSGNPAYTTQANSLGQTKECSPEISRPCGKICLGWDRRCKIDPSANAGYTGGSSSSTSTASSSSGSGSSSTYPTYTTQANSLGQTKECNPAVSRPCGKICLGHDRECFVQPEMNP